MAQFPAVAAGQRITAALLDQIIPLQVIKPADQSLTSNTTLQNDTDLTLPVVAGATYIFICYLDFEGGASGSSDLKLQWSVPSGAALRYACPHINAGGSNVLQNTNTATTNVTLQTNGAATLLGVMMTGTLVMSSTPGNITLQWAQNTSSGTATIVHAQSMLLLIECS
jgi:mannose/fructose/N-acetylgalactosamine-specific phosphotransferase system component IID